MNDEQRRELVEELADALREAFWDGVSYDNYSARDNEPDYNVIADDLLTDRAASVPSFQRLTPRGVVSDTERREIAEELAHRISTNVGSDAEPDAETVERAISVYDEAVRVGLPDHIDPHRYAMQEALIAAIPSSADADSSWLDDALEPFSRCEVGIDYEDVVGGFWSNLWLKSNPLIEFDGTGPTRKAAILDACAKAKEAQ